MKSITTFDGDLLRAAAPMSIALTLEDELDISRGEMLAAAHEPPAVATNFSAALVWMNAEPLDPAKTYLLKHTSQTVKAKVTTIRHRVNMQTLEPEPAATLELNSIGEVEVETTRPLFLDPYAAHRHTGSFILIDPVSHATVAAGMVREVLTGGQKQNSHIELLRQVENRLIEAGSRHPPHRDDHDGADRRYWASDDANHEQQRKPWSTTFSPLPARKTSASPAAFRPKTWSWSTWCAKFCRNVPVIFLDTGYHFAETYEYRDRLARTGI